MNIANFIPTGKDNAITRAGLIHITGLPDRVVRREIEKARKEGFLIINDMDGRGYYLSNDIEAIKKQYIRTENRIKSLSKQNKHMRKVLKRYDLIINGQQAIDIGGNKNA